MPLRDYQRRSVDELYRWLGCEQGNPVLVLPTGSGKSHVIAALCEETMSADDRVRVLILARQKELLEQNAGKILAAWQDAPLGVYSAGIGRREVNRITVASVQTVARRADEIGHVDAVIVDECHQISPDENTQYRQLFNALRAINPRLRVIGLTATPYRLRQGLLTEGDNALFHGIIDPVTIEELIHKKALSPLTSKWTKQQLDTTGVKMRGGDYVESELAKAVNSPEQNRRIAAEIVELAGDRKSWILFCTGVEHAKAMSYEMMQLGITSACVHGETPKEDREAMLTAYKDGRLRCLTNANVLTTGFDAPQTDMIAFLRPTQSAGLYVQMAGRGMRIAEGKNNCLCLDFAGVVQTHGPITAVKPPDHKQKGKDGECPVKICNVCHELVATATRECPTCGFKWPEPEKKDLVLHDDNIMKVEKKEMRPHDWNPSVHTSKKGVPMLRIDYVAELGTDRISEYLCLAHGGYAQDKGRRETRKIFSACGAPMPDIECCKWEDASEPEQDSIMFTLNAVAASLYEAPPPASVKYKLDGQWPRVLSRHWDQKWQPPANEEPEEYRSEFDDLFGEGDDIPF